MMPEAEQPLILRVTELEMQVMHLERTVSQLNEVLIEQQQWIAQLEKAQGQTRRQLGLLTESLEDPSGANE